MFLHIFLLMLYNGVTIVTNQLYGYDAKDLINSNHLIKPNERRVV